MEFKANKKQSLQLKEIISRAANVQAGLPMTEARPERSSAYIPEEEPLVATEYLIGQDLFQNAAPKPSDDFEDFLKENEEYSEILNTIPNPELDRKCWLFISDVLDILVEKGMFTINSKCPDSELIDFFESIEEQEKFVYNKMYFSHLAFSRKDSKNMCIFLKEGGEVAFVIQGDMKPRVTPYNLCKNLENNKKDFYKDLMSFVKLCLNV